VLFAWSGPGNAQDRPLGVYKCTDDCPARAAGSKWAEKWQITDGSECLWAADSVHEGCLADTEDPDRGADEDDDPVDEPTDEWT
jgi:hypothetical protein